LGFADPPAINVLKVIAEGEGPLADASKHFPDNAERYCLLRKEHIVEISKTVKFAFITWMPAGIKALRRGMLSTLQQQVAAAIKPFHVELNASTQSELDENVILKLIGAASGTASNVTETGKGRDAGRGSAMFKAAPASGASSSASAHAHSEHKVDANPALKAGAAVTITFADKAAMDEAMKSVRDDTHANNWLLTSYNKKDTLSLIGTGSGGLDELVSKLEADLPNFGLLRVNDMADNKIKTVKFVLIVWQPDTLKPMLKGELSTRLVALKNLLHPYHVEIFAAKQSEISEKMIMDLVTSASGSKSHVVDKPPA
jgi:hypothetical protein